MVDERLRTLLEVQIQDAQGRLVSIPAILDTGCQFALVLPRQIASRLGLRPKGSGRGVRTAGGDERFVPAYTATIMWNGYRREIEVVEMDNPPIVGTELLEGFAINIEMRKAGRVMLEPLSAW